MSTPLPPELARLERALEASRAALPVELRDRVLAAASRAVPLPARPALSPGWFAASVALAAALLLNVSASAALSSSDATETQLSQSPARCAVQQLFGRGQAPCLEAAAFPADGKE